jgi:hypothetical protein
MFLYKYVNNRPQAKISLQNTGMKAANAQRSRPAEVVPRSADVLRNTL